MGRLYSAPFLCYTGQKEFTVKKRKIAIATPSYDGKVACNFAVSIAEIFRIAGAIPEIEVNLQFWMYEALVQKSRNNLFADAYNGGFDDLIFIDADQSFPAEMFFKLLVQPVDVVGVPVRMKTEQERYNIRPEDPKRHEFDETTGLLKVENIGTGFLRLSRKAMQALWDASPQYNDGGQIRRMICNLEIVNGGIISEDIQICEKLRKAGMEIYVDIEYTAKHFGTKCFEGNYKEYYQRSI